jgi:4-hydroxy-tetrahydrodipicolinate synthase
MNNRLPITVGVSSESNFVLRSRILECQDLGASAFLICPPRMNKPNETILLDYFRTAQESSKIPIVLQDLPSESGIFLNPEIIKKLKTEFPLIEMLKLEDPPTPPKISKILESIPNILIFGGLGGAFFLEELQRGASGTMTGFAYPEVLISIYKNMKTQNFDKAINIFYKWLPLIRYENSVGISISIRKNILKHRKLIKNSNIRKPTPEIDSKTLDELNLLLSTMELDQDSENFSI